MHFIYIKKYNSYWKFSIKIVTLCYVLEAISDVPIWNGLKKYCPDCEYYHDFTFSVVPFDSCIELACLQYDNVCNE